MEQGVLWLQKRGRKRFIVKGKGLRKVVREERGNGLLQEGPSWVFGGFWRKELEEGLEGLYFIVCEKNKGPKLGRGFLWEKIYKLVITPKCDKEVVGEEIMKKILQISNCEFFICGWKQGKVNNSLLYVKKDTSRNKKNFDVLEVEILFYTMINMMIIFHFLLQCWKSSFWN